MRFDYGRVKAQFIYESAATYPSHRGNAYIRRRSKLCNLEETCFGQSPDTGRASSGKVRGATQEDPIR